MVVLFEFYSSKWTPLHYASYYGHTETSKILLENQAAVDPLDEWKKTPLHLAAFNGQTNNAKLLVDHG